MLETSKRSYLVKWFSGVYLKHISQNVASGGPYGDPTGGAGGPPGALRGANTPAARVVRNVARPPGALRGANTPAARVVRNVARNTPSTSCASRNRRRIPN